MDVLTNLFSTSGSSMEGSRRTPETRTVLDRSIAWDSPSLVLRFSVVERPSHAMLSMLDPSSVIERLFEAMSQTRVADAADTVSDTAGISRGEMDSCTRRTVVSLPVECYVCLERLLPGSCVRVIEGCGHRFCVDCIDRWLSRSTTCPVCKYDLRVQA